MEAMEQMEMPHHTALEHADDERRSWLTKRKVGAIAAILALPVASVIEARQFEGKQTQVIEHNLGPAELREQNRNSLCIITSGLGNDMTDDIGDALHDELDPRCKILRVLYSNAGVDTNDIAHELREYIDDNTIPNKPVDLTFYGGSMGALVNADVASRFVHNNDRGRIHLKAFLLDSSPLDRHDTTGAVQAGLVSVGSTWRENGDWLGYPFKNQVSLGIELAARASNGDWPDFTDKDHLRSYMSEAQRISGLNDQRLYGSQLNIINTKAEHLDFAALNQSGAYFGYLRAADPGQDKVVNVSQAYMRWKSRIPSLVDMPVEGGGHANPNEAPGYRAVIAQSLNHAGITSCETRHPSAQTTCPTSRMIGHRAIGGV